MVAATSSVIGLGAPGSKLLLCNVEPQTHAILTGNYFNVELQYKQVIISRPRYWFSCLSQRTGKTQKFEVICCSSHWSRLHMLQNVVKFISYTLVFDSH